MKELTNLAERYLGYDSLYIWKQTTGLNSTVNSRNGLLSTEQLKMEQLQSRKGEFDVGKFEDSAIKTGFRELPEGCSPGQ